MAKNISVALLFMVSALCVCLSTSQSIECHMETPGIIESSFRGRPEVYELEVYTLGVDEKWRNVGEAPYPLCGSFSNANVNGFVHWLEFINAETSVSIYFFNIDNEEVKSLPTPPGVETPSFCLTLVELGNCLCLSDNGYSEYVDIWWMKEYGIAESWIKDRILMHYIPIDKCDDMYQS
ncbi:hypothetical protein RND71_003038 [Anisodus tanguticus]|uniref:F-box associated beta-propeller type 3 domain-containing protein n=1 Tax=Anisodus tanguticus TaxID=243964 RepID=A0AAE1SX59_9SOLA|nr:hypothetical protein RND71_003038 [Anisodus tanguticus]